MSYVPYEGTFVRSPYNYDVQAASVASGLVCGPGMTQQQFKEECDINHIVEAFGVTGFAPVSARMPEYGDFTSVNDFQSAMQAVRQAEESFMQLPANVRERFGHSPQRLLEFCAVEGNLEEAQKLGLVKTPPERTEGAVGTPPST